MARKRTHHSPPKTRKINTVTGTHLLLRSRLRLLSQYHRPSAPHRLESLFPGGLLLSHIKSARTPWKRNAHPWSCLEMERPVWLWKQETSDQQLGTPLALFCQDRSCLPLQTQTTNPDQLQPQTRRHQNETHRVHLNTEQLGTSHHHKWVGRTGKSDRCGWEGEEIRRWATQFMWILAHKHYQQIWGVVVFVGKRWRLSSSNERRKLLLVNQRPYLQLWRWQLPYLLILTFTLISKHCQECINIILNK